MRTRACKVLSLLVAIGATWPTWSYSLQATGHAVPEVQLVSPVDGSFVTGATVLRAHVDPSSAASSAVFSVNGREVCRRGEPRFECEWDAGSTIVSHQVRLVVNLRTGSRIVQTARTAGVAYAEKVDVDFIQVPVTVTDGRGRYVKGLPRSAFHVFEDGNPQSISNFYADDAPLELVVALDLSTSMRPSLPGLRNAVAAFLSALPSHHRLTLLGFNDEVFTLLQKNANVSERESVVTGLSAWGMTALYEAVIHSVDVLGSRQGRRAVVVFTDGKDQGSHVTVEDVERIVHSSDSILYMIGQGQEMLSKPLTELMDRLAVPTGGRTLSTTSIDALRSAFSDLFEEMSHQYVLGYQARSGTPDDRWREITVKVDGDYRIRARQGYRTSRK
jgi:Ca-activated chloride channel homolog